MSWVLAKTGVVAKKTGVVAKRPQEISSAVRLFIVRFPVGLSSQVARACGSGWQP